jgi:hypothetical protein
VTNPQVQRPSAADERRVWTAGGSLLIASVLISFGLQAAFVPFAGTLASVASAAALLLFALGFRGAGSVTARRPLGTSALVVLSVWSLVAPMIAALVVERDIDDGLAFGYGDILVQFVAALVAVTQIARAGVVLTPWNRAPALALAAMTASWAVLQVVAIGGTGEVTPAVLSLMSLDGLVHMAAPLFLGVVAVVLANRARRPRTVPVYRTPG